MLNIQRVKQGAKITFYNGVYMILLGLIYIIFAKFNMSVNFDSISQLWGFFEKYNPKIANLFILFNFLIGFLIISMGIILIYLSDFIIRRKEKMTWIVLVLIGITGWGSLLIISILSKNIFQIILNFIGWVTFIIGMLLPIRYYLDRGYMEY